ncbi:MAG: hypothetical protein LBH91_05290 [Prevotellaceae bacterium]|jgi:hypothetical protein|nr:hypothetical protein [Prevotellaceae bacterium]
MKNFLLAIAIAFVLTSCSKDNSEKEILSPPAWIHGEWEVIHEMGVREIISIYKFTSDNIIITSDGMEDGPITISFREYAKRGAYKNLSETIKTDDFYEITFTSTGTAVYRFKKGDGTYIEYIGKIDGVSTETFRLDKK